VSRIDSTARIAGGARIGDGCEIGPYCVIGPGVTLGEGARLVSHVSIQGHTTIGPRARMQPFVSLGSPPQSVHYKGEPSRLIVGSDCDLREGVTMNTGTAGGRMETRVGDHALLMTGAHVGHDCIVGDRVIMANTVALGGHAEIGDNVFLGGLAAVHQFVRVGEQAMVGGCLGVRHDVIPFGAVAPDGSLGGLNLIGLKRRGFSRDAIHELRAAYRDIFFGEGSMLSRTERAAITYPRSEPVQKVVAFIRGVGKRRLTVPSGTGGSE
jgi:UDP-N-acetylglucosamine acyltransferase